MRQPSLSQLIDMKKQKPYSGVVVPMITPFTESGKIDVASVHKLVPHLTASGTLPFVAGTTGEGPSISRTEKRVLVSEACKAAAGSTPVYAGISSNCLAESVEEAKAYHDLGAAVIVATMPAYYPADPDAMLRYFTALADAIPLPLMLYNIPATTHLSIPIALVDKLSHHPNMAGFKDSERGLERIDEATRLWAPRDDFSYFTGWAVQSQYALQRGADGIVPSSGNLVPGVYQAILEAASNGDEQRAAKAQQKGDAVSALYQKDRTLGASLAAFKAMLRAYGLCEPHMLPPLYRLQQDKEEGLQQTVVSTFGDLTTINQIDL